MIDVSAKRVRLSNREGSGTRDRRTRHVLVGPDTWIDEAICFIHHREGLLCRLSGIPKESQSRIATVKTSTGRIVAAIYATKNLYHGPDRVDPDWLSGPCEIVLSVSKKSCNDLWSSEPCWSNLNESLSRLRRTKFLWIFNKFRWLQTNLILDVV